MSSPKRTRPKSRGLFFDPVSASDFMNVPLTYCCEQCSHFIFKGEACSLGHFTKPHLRREQIKSYTFKGAMAFCRSFELD